MELKFQHALFLTGAGLILIGAISAILNSGANVEGNILDSLSHGFNTVFMALFSGVLIGVGVTLVADGLFIRMKKDLHQIFASLALSFFALAAGAGAVANPATISFPSVIIFFAGAGASGTLILSSIAFALSGALRKYFKSKRAMPEHKLVK